MENPPSLASPLRDGTGFFKGPGDCTNTANKLILLLLEEKNYYYENHILFLLGRIIDIQDDTHNCINALNDLNR